MTLGLSLDLSGRMLLTHEDGAARERGFSAALSFDPSPATRRGPSLGLRQDFCGRFTGVPQAEFETSPGGRGYSVGWSLAPESEGAPDLSLGVKAARRESAAGAPEHALEIELSVRW